MQKINDGPSGVERSLQEVVEVKLWEVYLTRSRNNLSKKLSGYALDNGPLKKNLLEDERISFRFMKYDWDKTIQPLLISNTVPFEIIDIQKMDVLNQVMKKKIYLAEDDLDILFALNTILEDAGYDVILSHCGTPMLQKNIPATDVFILDKRMPDVDGIMVCKHLRQQAATQSVPVIMISASRDAKDQALKAGVNYYLPKPFQMHDLLDLVSKCITQSNSN
jgi:CheY-like chemotaxis protein